MERFVANRKFSRTTRENAIWWSITCWALLTLVSAPAQMLVGLFSQKWHISSGVDIPYLDFPLPTLILLVVFCLLRTGLMFSVLWRMRKTFITISRSSFFEMVVFRDLQKYGFRLISVGLLDVLSFPICYASLAAFDARVSFEIGIFVILALVLSPDKIVFGVFAYVGATTVRRGIELDNEIKLTV